MSPSSRYRFPRWLEYAVFAGALLSLGCGLAYPVAGVLFGSGGGGGGGGSQPSLSVDFSVVTTVDLTSAVFIDPEGKTTGPPQIVLVSPNHYRVTIGLNSLPAGEDLALVVDANAYLALDADGDDLVISDVCFYPYPPSQIPPGPGPCVPAAGPRFLWRDDPNLGAVLEITNPNPVTMNLLIEGAVSGVALETAHVYPGSPATEALVWSPVFGGALTPQQTVVVDLDDDAASAASIVASQHEAVLLRYSSSTGGIAQAGVYHLQVRESPISVESTTWGRIKSLYR